MTKGLATIAAEEQELRARLKTRTTAITNARLALERLEGEQGDDLAKLDALEASAVASFRETRAIADGPTLGAVEGADAEFDAVIPKPPYASTSPTESEYFAQMDRSLHEKGINPFAAGQF